MRDALPPGLEIEAFAHGAMCMAVSGRCLISTHLTGRSGNQGHCTQPCRWSYTLEEEKRPGVRFPVERAYGCRNEILNANKVFLADKAADWKKAGLRAIRLLFTTENGVECVQVLEAYRGKGNYIPNNFTRGLYYRDVE